MSTITFDRVAQGTATGRRVVRSPLRGSGGRRPVATAWQPSAPGGRPSQPGRPLTRNVLTASQPTLVKAAAPVQSGAILLTDRALTLRVVGFLLTCVLGLAVVVAQFVAISDAPLTGAVAQAAAAAPASQG